MTFDWLRMRRPGPPTRDIRGQPPMITRIHGKRPGPVVPVIPPVRRGHHRDHHHHSSLVPVSRPPPPGRRGPVVRPPARPHPPQRAPGNRLMQCFHLHFHPSQKRDMIPSTPRSSKRISSQQVPPFPPPRGAVKLPPKAPSRHVHWAPAQAPLPYQPYPYPSHISSSASSHPHARAMHYEIPMAIPRYQPPGVPLPPHRRR